MFRVTSGLEPSHVAREEEALSSFRGAQGSWRMSSVEAKGEGDVEDFDSGRRVEVEPSHVACMFRDKWEWVVPGGLLLLL